MTASLRAMAQKSTHEVVLSDEQRRELEHRAAACSSPHRDVVRVKAILNAAEGLTNPRSRSGCASRARPCRVRNVLRRGLQGLRETAIGSPRRFSPAQVAEVKALACELPAEKGVPLSRWSSAELAREAVERGIVAQVAAITVWRWLREDAIRPWNYRSWIFPRDLLLAAKARRVLDLTRDAGRASCSAPAISSRARMRSPRSKPARARTPASCASPAGMGSWSSTSTGARLDRSSPWVSWIRGRDPSVGGGFRSFRRPDLWSLLFGLSWR